VSVYLVLFSVNLFIKRDLTILEFNVLRWKSDFFVTVCEVTLQADTADDAMLQTFGI